MSLTIPFLITTYIALNVYISPKHPSPYFPFREMTLLKNKIFHIPNINKTAEKKKNNPQIYAAQYVYFQDRP